MLGASSARATLGQMTGWARELRPASFRGVTFYIENYSGASGRRGPDHEYPSRDTPFAEDLGRKQRVWQFTGYCIGDDYPSRRDRLIQACEQEGSGELVHPTIGNVQTVCRSCRWSEERERGRYCAFELEFHEAGALQEPTDQVNASTAVTSSSDPVGTTSITSFLGNFSTSGGGNWLNNGSASDITGFASTLQQLRLPAPTTPQSAIGQALAYLDRNAGSLASDPDMLAWRIDGTMGAFTDAGEALPVVRAMLRLISPQASSRIASISPRGGATQLPSSAGRALHPGVDIPVTIRRANNQRAFSEFTYRLALREIGYSVTGVDFDNYEQAQSLLRQILAAFAKVEDEAADAGDDEVFIALITLRSSIIRLIEGLATHLNSLVTYRVVSPQTANSLWLAWRLYANSGRDLEVVARTAARNPAFLPLAGRVLAP